MILHVDMDAFFASVEQLDNPSLKGRCVLVGGMSNRGVVAACSYEARKFGIRSAMPMYQARRKCPDAVIVPPRRSRYKEVSVEVMKILNDFSPRIEPVSIDEAYLDVTDCEKLYGDVEVMAAKIKDRIKEAVKLTCSVGGAPLKFLAKIASDLEKPDGLTIIRQEQMHEFIDKLPIGKVPGVGSKTLSRLASLQIKTLGDIGRYPQKVVEKRLGKFGSRLIELSKGIDRSTVTREWSPKSVSSEKTLSTNTKDRKRLRRHILSQAEDVAGQLRKKRMRAKTVTLKIKHADFTQITRQAPLKPPAQTAGPIARVAVNLLENYETDKEFRLIGVAASGLLPKEAPVQLDLFEKAVPRYENWEKVGRTVDRIARRFGKDSIQRASLTSDLKDIGQKD